MVDDIARREAEALESLERVGRLALYEPPIQTVADPLMPGTKDGWQPGTCVVTLSSDTGRVKRVTGVSAVHTLDQVESWLKFQRGLKPDAAAFFGNIVLGLDLPEYEVIQRPAGDAATTAARREETRRRVIGLDGNAAQLVSESR